MVGFSDLPNELLDRICDFAHAPRLVTMRSIYTHVWHGYGSLPQNLRWTTSCATHNFHHVCQRWREVYLHQYDLIGKSAEKEAFFYFNRDKDVLHLVPSHPSWTENFRYHAHGKLMLNFENDHRAGTIKSNAKAFKFIALDDSVLQWTMLQGYRGENNFRKYILPIYQKADIVFLVLKTLDSERQFKQADLEAGMDITEGKETVLAPPSTREEQSRKKSWDSSLDKLGSLEHQSLEKFIIVTTRARRKEMVEIQRLMV